MQAGEGPASQLCVWGIKDVPATLRRAVLCVVRLGDRTGVLVIHRVGDVMKDLFGDAIVDEKPTAISGTVPESSVVFLVASWYSPGMRWKIWDNEWMSRKAAEQWATRELAQIRGHTHYAILELRLPGIEPS